jgi:hypothetical protein
VLDWIATVDRRDRRDLLEDGQLRLCPLLQNSICLCPLLQNSILFPPTDPCRAGGDWLQGPYVYALYEHYGYTVKDIGRLFIAGFGSSMIFGTIVGSLADKQ